MVAEFPELHTEPFDQYGIIWFEVDTKRGAWQGRLNKLDFLVLPPIDQILASLIGMDDFEGDPTFGRFVKTGHGLYSFYSKKWM